MRVFITGGSGFIGSYVTKSLLDKGDEVIIYDKQPHSNINEYLPENEIRINGDILDNNSLYRALEETKPDVIIHMAAIVSTPLAMKDPISTIRVNIEGTINVLESMRKLNIKKGFSVSSEEVYGHFLDKEITEDYPLRPFSPYGITKAAADHYADFYRKLYSINLISVRTSWVYGAGYPRNRPELQMIQDAIDGTNSDFPTGSDQWLDFTYIDDFTDGLLLLIDKLDLKHTVYHISSNNPIKLKDLVNLIKEHYPSYSPQIGPGYLEYSPNGVVMPQKGGLNTSRAEEEIGFKPSVTLKEGIKKYIDYIKGMDRVVNN